ncbi:hypothetical protein CEP52_017675 [Fusarium oligoseptatum]|uniref:Uncharacterized protein n=1 Tax=Fusarium oligoseptatum TaxID=2604345 RepID=A0A428RK41_9HYPO|nr:hypothetical protein CEP52_017675 [Fusarium oligoseptatum]
MTVWPAMDDATEMALRKTDHGAVPEPVVVHVKSTATDMFGEKSLCFVTCHQNPFNVADSKYFRKAYTVIENLNAGIIKNASKALFRFGQGLRVICKFIQHSTVQRYRARFVLLRHIDGEEVGCSFQVLWPKPLASLLERVSRIMPFTQDRN